MKKYLAFTVLAGLTVTLLTYSCQSPNSENKIQTTSYEDSLTSEQLEYLVPSPGEVLSIIQDLGLSFKMEAVSPLKNPAEFPLFRNQALNFGVYMTDFSYMLLFEKQPESIKYLYQIQDMSVLLGINDYFNDDFFNTILANLNQPDSLKKLALNQTALFFNKMESLGNNELSLLISTGAMVEVIYLSSDILNEKNITDNTLSAVSNLAILFDSFHLHYTTSAPKDNPNEPLTNDLNEIRSIFRSMSIRQTSNAIRKDGKLIISNETQSEITDFNINKLKVIISKVRTKIANQEY